MTSDQPCEYCDQLLDISLADSHVFLVCTNADCPGPIDFDDDSDDLTNKEDP